MIAPIPTTWCAVYTYSVNSHDIPPLCILPILHPHRSLNNHKNNPHSHNTHPHPHPLPHPQRLPRLASPRPRRHPSNTQRLPPHLPPPPLRPPQPPRSSTSTTNPAFTRWLPSFILDLTTMQTRPPTRRPRNSPPPPNNPNRHTGNLRSPHVASRLDSRQTRTLARPLRGYVLF